MRNKRKGMTVTYWLNGVQYREYHDDAVRFGCKFYTGEQFDVLFDSLDRIIASYISGSVVGVEDHNLH